MPPSSGTRLGRYEVVSLLGAGGMGGVIGAVLYAASAYAFKRAGYIVERSIEEG
jgi:hypothetical protein